MNIILSLSRPTFHFRIGFEGMLPYELIFHITCSDHNKIILMCYIYIALF